MNYIDSLFNKPRAGCIDLWNAFMVDGAIFTYDSDMPLCPTILKDIPKELISYEDAKHLHKIKMLDDPNYHIDKYVHFYIDDQKFDGKKSSIWTNPFEALEIIQHFSGAISPDFSTNADFPDPIKRYNTYRMRAFGYWLTSNSVNVINNVRWGTSETWTYCFDGLPNNNILAIGTVASGLNKLVNRPIFEAGLLEMVHRLNPSVILIYGSANYPFFDNIRELGIVIISYPSKTNLAYSLKKGGEDNE